MPTITSQTNAVGKLLKASATPTNGIAVTAGTLDLSGTAAGDNFRSANTGTTMHGGLGDDVYGIYNAKDLAVESANQGTDTVVSSVNYTLGANIENLEMTADRTAGIGNDLDNIIKGGAGAQWLDGGAGNDVLLGGAGADKFVFSAGTGHDKIMDFENGIDTALLRNFGITSFDQVKADMAQVGSDVVLTLSNADSITFANHKVSDFSGADFGFSIDTSKMKMTFDDEFNSLSLWNGKTGTWRTDYGYGGPTAQSSRNLGENEVYTDPTWRGTDGKMTPINPFAINNGVLNITETKLTAAQSAENWGLQYSSGLLTTKQTFSQLYGYFEVDAKFPAGQGMWPAFWLLPANGTWPPELDVFEQLGKDPTTLYTTVHTSSLGAKNTGIQSAIHVDDVTQAFHKYGVLWTATDVIWYIDGNEVARTATPADMHSPMYMLLNLAVGGAWGGGITAATPDSATMQVDYVHAYSLDGVDVNALLNGTTAPSTASGSVVPAASTPAPAPGITSVAPLLAGSGPADALHGTAGNDTLVAKPGVTTLYGGAGNDIFQIKMSDLNATLGDKTAQKIVADFQGAGTWVAGGNDALNLYGFSKGSTLTWVQDDKANAKIGYYDIHDAASGHDYLIAVQSTSGTHLATTDYAFY